MSDTYVPMISSALPVHLVLSISRLWQKVSLRRPQLAPGILGCKGSMR
jgi:hypothetical protein